MFDFSVALDSAVDFLNEVVYLGGHNCDDAKNELEALVYASSIINGCDDLQLFASMFYKRFDALSWKSDIVLVSERRVYYLISSPTS